MSALHYAANAGHLAIVHALLAAHAPVNAVDEHGSTPLQWAAANCHLDVMRLLLANRADIDAADQVLYSRYLREI
jgi:ankyrin repeat protein